ncbi:hypothetical protein J4E89_000558 [Alternaria sp. Ai002NY15]|nr:hypothetical protein J4E89_000558 [Alternaria sp. Ai002NY15]
MAIYPDFPGLEVKVCVQGQPLHEYDDDKIPEPNTTTKYIEARSDETFSIVTVFKPPFPNQYDVGVRTYIDGVKMNTRIRKRDEILQRPMSSSHHYSCQGGEWVKQKFTFAKLNIGKYYEDLLMSSTYGFAQWKRLMNLPLLLLLWIRFSASKVVSLYLSVLSKSSKRRA